MIIIKPAVLLIAEVYILEANIAASVVVKLRGGLTISRNKYTPESVKNNFV